MATMARIQLNVFDGTRRPINKSANLLITLRDGNQNQIHRDYHPGPTVSFDVPYFNGLGDNYTVIVYADKYVQAGFAPVRVSETVPQVLDLMLLPKKGRPNFGEASWSKIKMNHHSLFELLSGGASGVTEAKARYEDFMTKLPGSLAALLNITTAMEQIYLPAGNPLSYFKELIWEEKMMKQDRFFAYADAAVVDQVKLAATQGEFAPQWGLDINHPGATSSFKQKQFGEANVQFSFHENDRREIDGVDCVKVETDMDYYKDPLAHLVLEALPNKITKGKTDPRKIYLLRWIAGRHAGVPEFDPPFTIEA
jgi:hypothetical protein